MRLNLDIDTVHKLRCFNQKMVAIELRIAKFWQAIDWNWLNKSKLLISSNQEEGFQMYHMKSYQIWSKSKEILVRSHFPTLAEKFKIW